MIRAMIELLTRRRVEGWAYVPDNPTTSVRIRVRDMETVLAQLELPAGPTDPPRGPSEKERARTFKIVFETPLDPARLNQVIVEAAPVGSDSWTVLSWQPYVPGPYQRPAPPVVIHWHGSESLSPVPEAAAEFWSDDPTAEPIDCLKSRPVFVLGAARSGTSALCLALEKATRYRGFPEGHVLDIGCRLVNAVNAHFEKKDSWIGGHTGAGYHLGRVTHAFFEAEAIALMRRLGSHYTTPFWFDKTPTYEMVASVPILAQAWPNARFVFMKRRGMENMCSRIRKFAKTNFRGNCNDWALIMAGWRQVKPTVADRFVEIDQHTLLREPESIATQVGRLLDFTAAEVKAFADILCTKRPEATDLSDGTPPDISELGWSDEKIETFREVCGGEMEAYGYTYDSQYCLPSSGQS